jgi:hypothetical protein
MEKPTTPKPTGMADMEEISRQIFCSESGSLKELLGNWIQRNKNRRHSAYFQTDNGTLWWQKDNAWTTHKFIQQHRTYWRFANESDY